jgi:uncharacterized membrane protein
MNEGPARVRGPLGRTMSLAAIVATAIAVYLTWTKLTGEAPVCGPSGGCETVENSTYSVFLGAPVALFGVAASVLTLAGDLAWWGRAERRGLYLAYGMGIASLPIIAYLIYLELAVIHAVCLWCAAYDAAVLIGWAAGGLVIWRGARTA